MYLPFFGLAEKPFSITPDPRYLYLSGRHSEALAHLVYGITEAGGFIQLTGEVGTGKTTIIRSLLARAPEKAEIALILNPRMNAAEFMLTICEELGILLPDSAEGSVKELIDILNRYLLKAHAGGKRVVLIVDEAQNLSPDLLEQVRLLTNLETETQKLLQIILIGQPELRDLLARNDLRQLAQRITGRYHLDPLSRTESQVYIKHRLRVAGATQDIFTTGALRELYRVSRGVPRLLNIIADRALLGAFSEDRHEVTAPMVRRAAGEVFDRRLLPAWLPWAAGAASLMLLAGGLAASLRLLSRDPAPAALPAQAAPPAAPTPDPAAAPTAAPATAPAAGIVENPLRTIGQMLADPAVPTDLDAAYAQLFLLWDRRYVAGPEDACTQALRQGLECLSHKGSFEQLRLYNRPAILRIDDATGPRQVVLARLDGDHAQLSVGGLLQDVTLASLLERWSGDFVLLWKPFELDTRPLAVGMQGAPVAHLREGLERWAGVASGSEQRDYFDDRLRLLVERFQTRAGLDPDGIAGRQTQAALVSVGPAAPDTPLLRGDGTGG
jgi:general secretion pathway protein A